MHFWHSESTTAEPRSGVRIQGFLMSVATIKTQSVIFLIALFVLQAWQPGQEAEGHVMFAFATP